MKTKLLLLFVILLVSVSLAAAVDTADIRYSTENQERSLPIVTGVPFILNVAMKATPDNAAAANPNKVKSIKLYTLSTTSVTLQSGDYRGNNVWLQSIIPDEARPLNNNLWLYLLSPTGDVELNNDYKRVTSIKAVASADGTVNIAASEPNEIGKSPSGTFQITSTPLTVSPLSSRCGDRVIDTAAGEVCDNGNQPGCKDNGCQFVDLRYTCQNTGILGNLQSSCTRLGPKEYLLARLNAIILGQCYPNNNHPDKLYCDLDTKIVYDAAGQLDLQNKLRMIVQMSTALSEFFGEVIAS